MSQQQKTIKESISFTGKGLHTGLNVTMTINSAAENHGIKFQRIDLEERPIIDALAENVTDTSRGTTIEKQGVKVSTIEHVMAAVWGCGIDNALIEINAPETPIIDGSSIQYVEKILKVGLTEQNAPIEYYKIADKIEYTIEDKGVKIEIYPDDKLSLNVNVDYNSKVLGNQYATLESIADFPSQIAPCRTFAFLHELEPLITHNLIKGGDLDNAIIVVENPISTEELERLSKLFHKENIKVDDSGYLNNLELRFANEPARHKLLDIVGDLALIGRRINGKVIATRPGHLANTELAKIIRKQIKREGVKPIHAYDPNAIPVYDINQIKNILPHRPPFLLVDKIMHIDDRSVMGIKSVTMNEHFFVGHFPSRPVMPGVLIIEAMAQCGGILALSTVPDPENYLTFFMKIDGVKFKKQVVPGDTLQFELELLEPIRRGIVLMSARAFVGGSVATEAILMAQISKGKN